MMPQEEFRPGLTLYFPKRNWEITLYKRKLTVGGSPFADITLGEFSQESEACVEFYLEGDRWMARRLGGKVVKNKTELGEEPVTCAKRDAFFLGSEELFLRNIYLEQRLDHNQTLFFESIHLQDGHVGSEITYDAGKRLVTYRKWGIIGGVDKGTPAETLEVPDFIATKEALCCFVADRKPGWPIWKPEHREEDQLIYFDGQGQIRFDGRSRMAVYATRWEGGWKTVETYACGGMDKGSIRAELRRRRPHWPVYKHELLGDFEVITTRRGVVIRYYEGFLIRVDTAVYIPIPVTVTDREGVVACAMKQWPELYPNIDIFF